MVEEVKRNPKAPQEKLGIMGDLEPVEGYKETDEYKRIQEIDKRLWELVK